MLAPHLLTHAAREHTALRLKDRGFHLDLDRLAVLDQARRTALADVEALRQQRRAQARQGRPEPVEGVPRLKDRLAVAEQQAAEAEVNWLGFVLCIPNVAADAVPLGADAADNVEVARWGAPTQAGPDHLAIAGPQGGDDRYPGLDPAAGALLAGARFTVLRGPVARLHRALGQFALDHYTLQQDYTEVAPPLMVHHDILKGTGQLPKFAEDLFGTAAGATTIIPTHTLIPTAEVPLTNLVREAITDPKALPLKMAALTPCFRAEAGAAGRDTRGLIRQHQFEKVELVRVVNPEGAPTHLAAMLEETQALLRLLALPHRVVALCAGDMGFAGHQAYDIEVWLPGQNTYREIATITWCGDFQARRMNARTRDQTGKTTFVHTLNGTGLAVGRALVALLENHHQGNGVIAIPEALRPYLGGAATLVLR